MRKRHRPIQSGFISISLTLTSLSSAIAGGMNPDSVPAPEDRGQVASDVSHKIQDTWADAGKEIARTYTLQGASETVQDIGELVSYAWKEANSEGPTSDREKKAALDAAEAVGTDVAEKALGIAEAPAKMIATIGIAGVKSIYQSAVGVGRMINAK